MEVRDKAIIALPPVGGENHTDKRGFFVRAQSGGVQIVIVAGDMPLGVIVQGEAQGGVDTIALPAFGGTVKVKLAPGSGAVDTGQYLVLDDTLLGAVKDDPGTGARVRVARALESGVAGELIEAYLVEPTALS